MILLSSVLLMATMQVTLIYRCEQADGSLTLSGQPCAEANAENMSIMAIDELPDNRIPSPNATKPAPTLETPTPVATTPIQKPAKPIASRQGYADRMELKNLQTVRRSRSLNAIEKTFLSAEMQRVASGQFALLSSQQKIARSNALNSLGMGRNSNEIYDMIDTVENLYRMQGQTVESAYDAAARRSPTLIYQQPYTTYQHPYYYYRQRPNMQFRGRYQSDKVDIDIKLSD